MNFALRPIDFEAKLTGPESSAIAMLRGFSVLGTLADGGDSFHNGELQTLVEGRAIAPLFYLLGEDQRNAESICDMAKADYEYACETCPSDAAPLCISLTAAYFRSKAVDLDLQTVADFSMNCDSP